VCEVQWKREGVYQQCPVRDLAVREVNHSEGRHGEDGSARHDRASVAVRMYNKKRGKEG
jgi:hypothetical protein